MNVDTRSIEKPNQRRVCMPDLVGTGASNADLGLRWVDAQTRPSPFVQSHYQVTSRRRGEATQQAIGRVYEELVLLDAG